MGPFTPQPNNRAGVQPRKCEKCEATHFFEITAGQYQANVYGSTPGSELRRIDDDVNLTLLVCMSCGATQTPNVSGIRGGRMNDRIVALTDSLKVGRTFHEVFGTAAIREEIGKAAEQLATREEVQALQRKVASLQKLFDDMTGGEDESPEAEGDAPRRRGRKPQA